MKAKSIQRPAIITAAILLIPLIAMQFSDSWDWDVMDFVIIGALVFGAGLLYEFTSRRVKTRKQRVIVCAVVILGVMYVWAELAVGIFTNWGS